MIDTDILVGNMDNTTSRIKREVVRREIVSQASLKPCVLAPTSHTSAFSQRGGQRDGQRDGQYGSQFVRSSVGSLHAGFLYSGLLHIVFLYGDKIAALSDLIKRIRSGESRQTVALLI